MQVLIRLIFPTALVGCGLWILGWSASQVSLSLQSTDWPNVPGTVVSSHLKEIGEPEPVVLYRYEVDGTVHESTQLGFDLFGKPGGRGLAKTRVARYPAGSPVTVFVHPDDPKRSVLEPGDVAPFGQAVLFGGLFVLLGSFFGLRTLRAATGRRGPMSPETRVGAMAVTISMLLYAVLVVVTFDSGVSEVLQSAGAGSPLQALALQTVLFVPIPIVTWHLAKVMVRRPGGGIGFAVVRHLLAVRREGGSIGKAATVSLAGLAYVVVICAAWIAWASYLGI